MELKICEIIQNFHTQVLVFLLEGAKHHENSITYRKGMTKRDELEPFTVCLLNALESDYHDRQAILF